MTLLARIKRCALLGRIVFTYKATDERVRDDLSELEILESLVNATEITKTLRSTRSRHREYLHVITSPTAAGIWIYTKGKFVDDQGVETYYLLISAKLAE